MDLLKFKEQHVEILAGIDRLRKLAHAGAETNAAAIASGVVALSSTVRLHLAIEDRVLYPTIEASADPALTRMSRIYQGEMQGIAASFMAFVSRWNTPQHVQADPAGFREEANVILKHVFERMQRENREFYPAIERVEVLA
jgi:hypothetical protein